MKVARKTTKKASLSGYAPFLQAVKNRIRAAQTRAAFSANAELVKLYWDIGRAVDAMQKQEGWGAGVIPRLARDIVNGMPEVKGFSERNIKRMLAFAREYPGLRPIMPQPVALLPETIATQIVPQPAAQFEGIAPKENLPQAVAKLPWGHNVILMEKVKNLSDRLWYARQTIQHGWSRSILAMQIDSQAHKRQGKAVHNFRVTLPSPQSGLAEEVLKDPYVFDFLTIAEPFRERELELGLLAEVEKFLLELGQGFAFVGRQYHLTVSADDFYIDLLFYHLRLRCFFVVDLKRGPFKAEYAGKMNFYCNLVDRCLRHPDDKPSIGLILCQDRNHIVAEYALKGVEKAIGVSTYRLTRALPKELQSSLPTVEEMESELLTLTTREKPTAKRRRK